MHFSDRNQFPDKWIYQSAFLFFFFFLLFYCVLFVCDSVFFLYIYICYGWTVAQDKSRKRKTRCIDVWERHIYSVSFLFFFFIVSVVFLVRSIFADRFRNKISAQVSMYVHANVLIRLASAIDEISFFKFFASLSSLSLFQRKKIIRCAFSFWRKRENEKIIFQHFDISVSTCLYCQMSLTSSRHHHESGRLDNITLSRPFFIRISIKKENSKSRRQLQNFLYACNS